MTLTLTCTPDTRNAFEVWQTVAPIGANRVVTGCGVCVAPAIV